MGILLFIVLLFIGIGAFRKGEVQISKKRKIKGGAARTIGVVFLLTAISMLFVPNVIWNLALVAMCVVISIFCVVFVKGSMEVIDQEVLNRFD